MDGSVTDFILGVTSTALMSDQQQQQQQKSKEDATVDYDWIINHAMQIHDMLVGGMDILGVYCVDLSPSVGKQVCFFSDFFFFGFFYDLISSFIKRYSPDSLKDSTNSNITNR